MKTKNSYYIKKRKSVAQMLIAGRSETITTCNNIRTRLI